MSLETLLEPHETPPKSLETHLNIPSETPEERAKGGCKGDSGDSKGFQRGTRVSQGRLGGLQRVPEVGCVSGGFKSVSWGFRGY